MRRPTVQPALFWLLIHEVSKLHTTTHHSRVYLDERPARRRDLYLTTHTKHSQQKNFHAPGGIRTHDPSRRMAVELRLRPRDPLGLALVHICGQGACDKASNVFCNQILRTRQVYLFN